ncbi:hypothetical protein KVR01_010068 [Diaporthe batatas]|uniref:uncharacterized protein n=1 Tax=Diaporthe batatas TaxID=748121 RepID=UPI001D04D5F4|nr:uncharacterized protein KVR01_010068 [Diaporthe batatas]KAG8160532.1 hypothetical protein KVR01_010068 [Diaporthe batatas]
MLAVQRPRMGSSQPNDGTRLPFGYMSEDQHPDPSLFDFLPHPPPDPAPGNPILTTAEENGLANMLAGMVSNGYGEQNFGEGLTADEWMMPPNLMATATSYGLHPQLSHMPDNLLGDAFYQENTPQTFATNNSMLASAPPATATPNGYAAAGPSQPTASTPVTGAHPNTYTTSGPPLTNASPVHHHPIDQPQPSEDVLAAANVLHSGSHGRSHSLQHETMFSNAPQRTNNMGPPVGHLRHQQWSEFKQEGRRMSQSTHAAEQEAAFSSWIYGAEAQPSQRGDPPRAPVDLQYGTDQSFSNNNQPFVPSSDKDSSEAIQKEHMRYFSAIELSKSTNTTRPTSPVISTESLPFNLKTRAPPPIKIEANGDGGKKWRKGKHEEDDDDDEPQSAVSKSSARKRKQKVDTSHSPGGVAEAAGSGKRRKSSAAAKRENLTEDQKRENHINSEKKRRKVIQTGFENLAVIVPAIKGSNPSKSAMLEAAVAWLEELLDGNETLKGQLSQPI